MDSNNCGAVRSFLFRIIISVRGIIAAVVQIIKNINCVGYTK